MVSYPDSALPLARARTQKIPNLPNCLYTKEILQILAKLRKNDRKAKGKSAFLFCNECLPVKTCFVCKKMITFAHSLT